MEMEAQTPAGVRTQPVLSQTASLAHADVSGAPGLTWYLSVLIGASVTFGLLLLVLPLFLFLRHRDPDRRRNAGE